MTYDPRYGASPYLGMEVEHDEPDELASSDASQAWEALSGVESTRQHEAGVEATRVEGPMDKTVQAMPATVRRPSQAPQRGVAPRAPMPPAATDRTLVRPAREVPRAVPSPEQQRFEPQPTPVPSMVGGRLQGPLTALESFALRLLALVLRLAAIGLSALVVLSAVLTGSHRAQLVSTLNIAQLYLPSSLMGKFVFETPFGGLFRGDMAVVALLLFILDWLCVRTAVRVRSRYERGR